VLSSELLHHQPHPGFEEDVHVPVIQVGFAARLPRAALIPRLEKGMCILEGREIGVAGVDRPPPV